MFLGEYQLNFNGKNRIILPKKIRLELGEVLILSRGLDGCIWGFSLSVWEEMAGRQFENSITQREARDLRRYLFSGAVAVGMDKQGRVVIAQNLIDYAQISTEMVLVGAGDHFEIWNKSAWQGVIKRMKDA